MGNAFRVLFWFTVVGFALALVAPMIARGASWQEAQVAVVASMLALVAFGIAGSLSAPDAMRHDPFATATWKRRTGMIASAGVLVVALPLGALVEVQTQADLDAAWAGHSREVKQWEQCMDRMRPRAEPLIPSDPLLGRYGGYEPPPRDPVEAQRAAQLYCDVAHPVSTMTDTSDPAAGTWTGVIALVGAGAALLMLLVLAAKKPTPPMLHPAGQGWPPGYGPGPHPGYVPYGYGQPTGYGSGYGPANQGPASYGPPSHGYPPQSGPIRPDDPRGS